MILVREAQNFYLSFFYVIKLSLFLQDNYMEEALKMRNLLQEFLKKHDGVRFPSILGLREHIFTGRWNRFVLVLLGRKLNLKFAMCHWLLFCSEVSVFLLLHGSCQIRRPVLWQLVRDCWLIHWSEFRTFSLLCVLIIKIVIWFWKRSRK